MLLRKILVLVMLVTMIGCKEKKEEEPPPPPLASEQTILSSLRESLNILLVRGSPTAEETGQELNKFQQALSENAADPLLYTPEEIEAYQEARKNARRSIQKDIEARIRGSRDLGGWRIVGGCIQAFEVVQPGNGRYDDLQEKARKMINMPSITSAGHFEREGVTKVILDIYDPVSNTSGKVNVREGQYFYNNRFRLTKIVGNNLEYEIEYCDVQNHSFTIKGSRRN